MKFRSAADARRFGAPLVRLYVTGLARAPRAAELAPPLARMQAGDDLGEVAAEMVAGAEFVARHGPDGPVDPHYIHALFRAAIGQDPSPLERDRLLAQPHATRDSVLVQVSQSAAVRDAVTLETHWYCGALPPDDDAAYQLWLDGGGEPALAFVGAPPAVTVSFVVRATAARPDLLSETLASLQAQSSPHWEALVVGAPPRREGDDRIRSLDGAGTGCEALNRAAAAASGRLVGFIEASDRLASQAVEAASRRAAATPGLRVLYTDEDSIAGDGTRSAVLLKPGWSPDLALSGDVLGQLVLFDRAALLAGGGLAAQAGAFALLDLALRLSADAPPGAVAHQPGILFHRGRAVTGRPPPFPRSRAGNGLPELDGVIDRFLARHRPGLHRGSQRHGSRIWPTITATLPSPAPRVSAVVPMRDRGALLDACLSGLLERTAYPDIEVLVVDNGSTAPDALAALSRWAADARVRVLRDEAPFNWSALNNRAAAQATGDVLLLLNNDVSVLEPDWLARMVAHAMRPEMGVVGARLLYPDGRLQHGGLLLGPRGAGVHAYTGAAADQPGYLAQVMVLRDLSAVTGACLAIRRDVFRALGGLEQEHLEVAWSDVDLCLRAREAGYRVVWDPAVTLVHHETATRGRDVTLAQQARFEVEREYMRRRWPVATESDPFLNPALRADTDALVFRAVTPPGTLAVPAGSDLAEEAQLEVAGLRRALHQAEAEACRLRGLWPGAELQRLRMDLAAACAAQAGLAAERDALAARLAGVPPRLLRLALALRVVPRIWQVVCRLAAAVRRTPGRGALLRQRRTDYAVIAASPLFDRAWYRAAAMAGDVLTDPVSHYLWKGAVAGSDPHALFDRRWYAARHPQIGIEDPFAHYIRCGMAEGRDPHPLFDTAYYLAQAPEAAGRALLHQMQQPAHATRSPVPLFDPVDYPEGLAHWARSGAAADRDPHALFDTAWYRRTFMGGDRARNPLAHWVREGRAAGLPTNPHGLDPATPPRLPQPGAAPAVSILVARGPTAMHTTRTLLAIAQHSPAGASEVILTGSGPAVAMGEALRAAPDLHAAVPLARGRLLVLLGAGAVVHAGWLDALLETADADGRAGAIGCKTLTVAGGLRSAGVGVGGDGRLRYGGGADPALPEHGFARLAEAVDGGAMLVRREAWDEVGGLARGYATDGYAAADLALALQAQGWRVRVQPASVVTLDGVPEPCEADRQLLRERWAPALSMLPAQADPAAAWRGAVRRVLVLADAVPTGDAPGCLAPAIGGLLQPGTRVVLHALRDDGRTAPVADWERRGVEVLRSPVLIEDWLARFGAALDEVWSFRAPADVPAAALLRWTGARLLHAAGGPLPPWCDGALAEAAPEGARAAA